MKRLWGASAGMVYPLEGKPNPDVDCGDKKYWKVGFSKRLVLLFRVSSDIYAHSLGISTSERDLMIGLLVNEDSPFADLVNRKFSTGKE